MNDFDVREFTRSAQGRFRDELDLDRFAGHPVDPADRPLLRFLARVEGASMEHLRDVLMTATHKNARVTAFLVTWAYERSWIADALDAVLTAHGEPGARGTAGEPPRRRWSERRAWRGPVTRALAAIRQGDAVVAAHMAAGLVDGWVLGYAYRSLAGRTTGGPLSAVIDRLTIVKDRHTAFFAAEAGRLLAASDRAVRLTRAELRHAVFPIGSLRRPAADRRLFAQSVFGGGDGRQRAGAIGARVAALPGMDAGTGDVIARRLTSG